MTILSWFFDLPGRRASTGLAAVAGLAAALIIAPQARALEEGAGEAERIKACEAELCGMILSREAKGADLRCNLSKTWAQSSLKQGESKGVSWMFGDARCSADIKLSRQDIYKALTEPKHSIRIPEQAVSCVVERDGETKPVTIKLAPKLTFKKGEAHKVWINLKEIEGPDDVKGTVWTAANIEDTIGIFHKPMLKAINKFVQKSCPKRYGPGAKTEANTATESAKTKAASAKTPEAKPDAQAAAQPPAP